MAYVSVGQVEKLEDTIKELSSTYLELESECQAKLQRVAGIVAAAQQEAENSAKMLEGACQAELEKEQALEQAQDQLVAAQEELSSAFSALSACESGGYYDDEGNWQPPDCSGEASDVSTAEASASEAEEAVVSASTALDQAKDYRMQMEERNELAQKSLSMATELEEAVQAECSARLSNASSLVETGTARLEHANSSLDAYLSTNPPAAEFYAWLKWEPKKNTPVTPAELNARLNLSAEQQRYFIEYLADRDPVFRTKIAEYRRELEASNGPVERHAVQLKTRRHLSGLCSEKTVEYALGPLAEHVNTQSRTTFDSGKFTKTDLVIEDLKVPVILGRGEGMSAPVGGSIAIEVKSGQSAYLYSQRDHMVFQSGGHQNASSSLTVCSRDIKDLSPEQEETLRAALREAGSPLVGMLPKKDEVDQACWVAVLGENVNSGDKS